MNWHIWKYVFEILIINRCQLAAIYLILEIAGQFIDCALMFAKASMERIASFTDYNFNEVFSKLDGE